MDGPHNIHWHGPVWLEISGLDDIENHQGDGEDLRRNGPLGLAPLVIMLLRVGVEYRSGYLRFQTSIELSPTPWAGCVTFFYHGKQRLAFICWNEK